MQSRYAAQPGTQLSAEMASGGQRAQNTYSTRMRYWIRLSCQYSRYQISITCRWAKFRSRVMKGQNPENSGTDAILLLCKTLPDTTARFTNPVPRRRISL